MAVFIFFIAIVLVLLAGTIYYSAEQDQLLEAEKENRFQIEQERLRTQQIRYGARSLDTGTISQYRSRSEGLLDPEDVMDVVESILYTTTESSHQTESAVPSHNYVPEPTYHAPEPTYHAPEPTYHSVPDSSYSSYDGGSSSYDSGSSSSYD